MFMIVLAAREQMGSTSARPLLAAKKYDLLTS